MGESDKNLVAAGTAADRSLCATTGRLLAAVAHVGGTLGLGCALLAGAVLAAVWLGWPGSIAPIGGPVQTTAMTLVLALVLGLTLLERGLALRLQFDAGLFDDLARQGATPSQLMALDLSLQGLGLRRASVTSRPLPDRVQGALRLARWHVVTVAIQVLSLAATLWLGARP